VTGDDGFLAAFAQALPADAGASLATAALDTGNDLQAAELLASQVNRPGFEGVNALATAAFRLVALEVCSDDLAFCTAIASAQPEMLVRLGTAAFDARMSKNGPAVELASDEVFE